VRTVFSRIACTRARLEALLALAADGKLVPLVGKSVSFAELPSAYAASQAGHVRGKIIVTVP
jgi:D-arabinose 1-dehydrogenase-like Zn-dependent alcohol dehydrogenase